eukprot:scaffold411970_cov28-Attheya_sp.AAC.1
MIEPHRSGPSTHGLTESTQIKPVVSSQTNRETRVRTARTSRVDCTHPCRLFLKMDSAKNYRLVQNAVCQRERRERAETESREKQTRGKEPEPEISLRRPKSK